MNLKSIFSLKTNKSPGYGKLGSNFIKSCFNELNNHLNYLFEKFIEKEIFSKALKITRVKLLFKGGDPSYIGNYRPISFRPVFSKFQSISCITAFADI